MQSLFELTDSEIYLLTVGAPNADAAMIVTYVMPATLVMENRRLLVALRVANYTTELVRGHGEFSLQLLSEGQAPLVYQFGLKSGREVDKFANVDTERSPAGHPLVADTCGHVDCRVLSEKDGGDRIVFLAETVAQTVNPGVRPLMKNAAMAALSETERAALVEKRRIDSETDRARLRQFREG